MSHQPALGVQLWVQLGGDVVPGACAGQSPCSIRSWWVGPKAAVSHEQGPINGQEPATVTQLERKLLWTHPQALQWTQSMLSCDPDLLTSDLDPELAELCP